MVTCQNCGASVDAVANFCPECGEALTSTIGNRENEARKSEPMNDRSVATSPESGSSLERPPSTEQRPTTQRKNGLQGRFWVNALLGSIVGFGIALMLTVVFFPVYFLGIITGGIVGGLLHDRGSGSGALIGVTIGVILTIPFLAVVGAIVVLGTGWLAISGVPIEPAEAGDLIAGLGIVAVLVSLVALIVNTVCGLIGGVIGGAMSSG